MTETPNIEEEGSHQISTPLARAWRVTGRRPCGATDLALLFAIAFGGEGDLCFVAPVAPADVSGSAGCPPLGAGDH